MMPSLPLSIAFIGGGQNSAIGLTHEIATKMDGKFQLVAGCFSSNEEINIKTGLNWRVEPKRIYKNWKSLIRCEQNTIDALVILTPIPTHTEIVLAALKAGIPVICEKALTDNSKDAKLIKKTVADSNGFLAVTYNYSGYPMLRGLRELINLGKFGNIKQIHVEMPQESFIRVAIDGTKGKPQNWRLRDLNSMPTVALDLGAHVHQLIHFLSGEKVVEVVATQDTFGHHNVVDNTICLAKYTNNLKSNIWYGKSALGHRNGLQVRVFGDKGSAEWIQMEPELIKVSDQYGKVSLLDRTNLGVIDDFSNLLHERFKAGHPSGFIEAFSNYYSSIADALIEYKNNGHHSNQWISGVDIALEGVLMLEAINESSAKNTWILV